jgi:phosphotransferase system  glucose/maltose/N-acetylglucosamine-specific IIC component
MVKKILNPILDYLQKIGKSLMLPVAVLPAAAILMGIGYWINPSYGQEHNVIAHFLFQSGSAIIDNMALLFAAGIAYGLSKDRDGGAVISGVIAFLVFITLLSSESVSLILNQDLVNVHPAFGRINNQFIGILAGIVGITMYFLQKISMKKPSYVKNTAKHNPNPQAMQTEKTMKFVSYFMIIIMVFASFSSNALALYWVFGNLYSLGQTMINRKLNEKKHENLTQKQLMG